MTSPPTARRKTPEDAIVAARRTAEEAAALTAPAMTRMRTWAIIGGQRQADNPACPQSKGDAAAVLKLVEKWLTEEDGYDASVWPVIVQDIEENRLSIRHRFQDQNDDSLLH